MHIKFSLNLLLYPTNLRSNLKLKAAVIVPIKLCVICQLGVLMTLYFDNPFNYIEKEIDVSLYNLNKRRECSDLEFKTVGYNLKVDVYLRF